MLKSTVFVAAAIVMMDKGVLAMRPQDAGLATPDIGQTSRVVLGNPSPAHTKSNYARAFAQDYHPDHHTGIPRDALMGIPSTDMHAPASGGHATTSDVETSSDMPGSSTEGIHSVPKGSTTLGKSMNATRASRVFVRTFTRPDLESASARPYSTSTSPVPEHPPTTPRTLAADDHAHSHRFDERSIALAGLQLSAADMSTLATLSASIATTMLGGILAVSFLFGTAAMTQEDIKVSPSTGMQITQAEQGCLDWRVRLCQKPGFVGENVGTMAVFEEAGANWKH